MYTEIWFCGEWVGCQKLLMHFIIFFARFKGYCFKTDFLPKLFPNEKTKLIQEWGGVKKINLWVVRWMKFNSLAINQV